MAGSSGTLVPPDIALIQDPEELYRQLMQLVGRDSGLTDWGSPVQHTSYSNNATYAHTDRNLSTAGGGLHYQALHSATGSAVVHITDDGLHVLGSTGPFLVGCIIDYAGSGTPNGWLLANGASVSRSTYALLFAAIGTTWGAVDGSHFTLPDLRGRVRLGASGSHSLNDTGGSEAHQHDPGTLANSSHGHGAGSYGISASGTTAANNDSVNRQSTGNSTASDGHTHTFTLSASVTGSSSNQNANIDSGQTASGSNMMPFAVVRPMIFAGV